MVSTQLIINQIGSIWDSRVKIVEIHSLWNQHLIFPLVNQQSNGFVSRCISVLNIAIFQPILPRSTPLKKNGERNPPKKSPNWKDRKWLIWTKSLIFWCLGFRVLGFRVFQPLIFPGCIYDMMNPHLDSRFTHHAGETVAAAQRIHLFLQPKMNKT